MTDTDNPSDKTHKPSVCDNQHSELKRLAEAATRGPWNYDGEGISDDGATYREVTSSAEVVLGEYGYVSAENAKYIAAANPHAILALIAENEELREERDEAISVLTDFRAFAGSGSKFIYPLGVLFRTQKLFEKMGLV